MRILITKAILSPEQLHAVTKHMTSLAVEMKQEISIDFLDLRVFMGVPEPIDIDDLYEGMLSDTEDTIEAND